LFEAVELDQKLSKDHYKQVVPQLRVDLVNAQYELQQASFPVIILILGDDRHACNAVLNSLMEWMDARYIETFYFGRPSQEEQQRPHFWRYWYGLPPQGKIGVFMGAWAASALAERVRGEIGNAEFERRCQRIRRFEQALADDGALILKFWLHLPKASHLQQRQKNARNGHTDDRTWAIYEHYDEAIRVGEQLVRLTHTERAPWVLVDSSDARYRIVTVAQTILNGLTARSQTRPTQERPVALPATITLPGYQQTVLSTVDLAANLEYEAYRSQLDHYQTKLHKLTRKAFRKGLSTILVFEGWDAAGKGGVIRRLTQAMDAEVYKVIPIGAPTDEEKAHHYLWRFWRQLPRAGRVLIFDRSWYGRVLVERVEGFASELEWQRAYGEINDFEEQLADHGIVLLKFWLHIDADEQLRRFKARENTPYKKYKITAEDYRNREKWHDYEVAVSDMVTNTSTEFARWQLISATDKRYARIQAIQSFCQALKQHLG
jgi:AMP-polyphosphate phosphotransferase